MKYILLLPMMIISTVFAEFIDVKKEDIYHDEIMFLQEKGVVHGYEDGSFRANNTINRAEFMKILLLASGKNVNRCRYSKPPLSDIEGTWYSDYAMIGHCEGIIQGYEDGTFGGDKSINFAEASKIIVNTFGLETSTHDAQDMSGEGKIMPWYQIYIGSIFRNGIAPRGDIMPSDLITRGEMASMIARASGFDDTLFDDCSLYADTIKNGGIDAKEICTATDGRGKEINIALEEIFITGVKIKEQVSHILDIGTYAPLPMTEFVVGALGSEGGLAKYSGGIHTLLNDGSFEFGRHPKGTNYIEIKGTYGAQTLYGRYYYLVNKGEFVCLKDAQHELTECVDESYYYPLHPIVKP